MCDCNTVPQRPIADGDTSGRVPHAVLAASFESWYAATVKEAPNHHWLSHSCQVNIATCYLAA